jgi:flagellar hook-basal body complex protein FliE
MSFMDSIGGQAASQAFMDPGSFDLGNIAEFAGEAAVQVGVAYATAQFGPVGGMVASQAASAITGGGQQSIADMKPNDFASFLTDALGQLSNAPAGDEQTVGEMSTSDFKDLLKGVVDQLQSSGEEKVGDMDQKEFMDALKDVVSQIGRDGQKETKKTSSEGEAGASGEAGEAGAAGGASEAGGSSGASLRDLAEALGKAVSDRVAAAKEKVSALTADSDQGQILEATSEVGAAGFLATSAGGAMQSAIQGTNELARKG